MGFIGYLCAYTPNREGKRERRGTQKKSRRRTPTERKEEQKKEA